MQDLDQLWYTWSKNGLDSMAMGYRVRAASGELRNTQSMRYRVLDRFLRYEPPQGININEFDARIAPISYAFISNGQEHLLIRKVFKGRDLAGRNSVFFTHLIAGLPDEFTVRDAIRLWDCTDVWVESEDNKAANDTLLNPLPYATLKHSADHSQPPLSLPFTVIRTKLEELLMAILCQNGLAQNVYLVGRSNLAAALIYGLTHCLPLTMLGGNFTFTTYENTINEIEATFMTTVTGSELADATYLDVHIRDISPASPTDLQKFKSYVTAATHYLLSGNVETFLGFLKKMEDYNCQTSDQLLEGFNLAFGQGPLTFKQVETIITHAGDYTDRLRDPLFQQQSALPLLDKMDYWQQQGKKTFQKAVERIGSAGTLQADPVRQALAIYVNGLAFSIAAALREGLSRVKTLEPQETEIAWKVPNHCADILVTLLPPAHNELFWVNLLRDFAQPPLYTLIKSDAFWTFQVWLLIRAGALPQPQRFLSQVRPWLDIPSWEKLKEILALDLPPEWISLAILGRIQDVPRGALPLIQKHDSLFIAALQHLLLQGGQININLASAFFQRMVEYGYPNRVSFLLVLVNTYYEAVFVQTTFACVGIATSYRLQEQEISAALAGCRPEVIATCNRAQALADYLREFILTLTPAKLSSANTVQLLYQLRQLSAEPGGLFPLLPREIADLVNHWLMVHEFINTPAPDRHLLTKTEFAIKHIRHSGSTHTAQLAQTFAEEFIPTLVKQASTEFDLEIIQDILGTSMTGSRWDLLRWMAMLAGKSKTRVYELMPYVICGIREAERSKQTQQDLNTYLQTLFINQDKELPKKIDAAIGNDIWPDPFRQKWDNWRASGKKAFSIPFVKSNTGRLQSGPQPLVLPGPNNSASTPASARQQVNMTLPAQSTPEQPAIARNAPAPAVQSAKILATLPALNRFISYEEYVRMHNVMPLLLNYWLNKQIPENKENSKLLNFEIKTLQQICKDLYETPKHRSRELLMYLADDLLIEEAVRSRVQSGSVLAASLDPESRLHATFNDFLSSIQGHITDQIPYINGMRALIRRYLVIYKLDDQPKALKDVFGKGGLQAFLEKEHTNIQF